MPDAKLFGPDGVATVDFLKEIPEKVQKQTFLTASPLSPDDTHEADEFYKDYEAEYGEPHRTRSTRMPCTATSRWPSCATRSAEGMGGSRCW